MENRTTKSQFIDETGNVYGGWTVIRRAPNTARGHSARWLCRCICGNENQIVGVTLRYGGSKSCGCLRPKAIANSLTIDLVGKRYGRLLVIKKSGHKHQKITWECLCDCGSTAIILGASLKKGLTTSCGCFRRERISLPPSEAAFNSVLLRMKRVAKSRGYEWKLSREEVKEITNQDCFYCGVSPAQINRSSNNGNYIYNGIDRVDNTGGYTVDNVVACCRWCNYAKSTRTISEFKEWIIRIYENFASRGQKIERDPTYGKYFVVKRG